VIKKSGHMSFVSAYVERRTKKNKFFNQIDSVIDWQPIEKEINKAKPLHGKSSMLLLKNI
jgi:hypothetical protein